MAADAELPVWSIKPNWSDAIIERLSWLTDVISSSWGTEQRRALRLSPRREFEMKFNPVNEARSYFDLWLHRYGSAEFMAPLFHDAGKLTAGIAAGATVIPFDTTYREFNVGDLAILIGDDPFTFDKVAVEAVAAGSITVTAGGVTQAWPKGSRIHPLRRARLSDESQVSGLTNRVGDATLQFQLNQANDLPDEGAWAAMFGDYPILLDPPNWRETIDLTFNRNSLLLDNDQGLRVLLDDTADATNKARAFTVQVDHRMMKGRAEHWAFRQMLYRLRGQQSAIWIPTFNRDIELSRAALAGDAAVTIKKIGYGYTGGLIDGRANLLLPNGLAREISGVGAEPTAKEENLLLSAALGTALPAGTFGSFIDTCRLSSDTVEIKHYTDTDGAAECDLAWQSFRDMREPPATIDYPLPVAAMVQELCGAPAAGDPCAPQVPASGYWGRFIVNTALGPNYPVIGPWSWQFTLFRGGVQLAALFSSDNYTDRVGGGGGQNADGSWDYLMGWTSYFFWPAQAIPRGEAGFAVDPFGGELPDELKINIQWPYNNYIFPGGSTFGSGQGTMDIKFELLNGPTIDFGTIPIFGLWPASYDLHA